MILLHKWKNFGKRLKRKINFIEIIIKAINCECQIRGNVVSLYLSLSLSLSLQNI